MKTSGLEKNIFPAILSPANLGIIRQVSTRELGPLSDLQVNQLNENPYQSSNAPISTDTPISTDARPMSESAIFKGWVVFFLLSTVFGFIAGVVAGGLLGALLGAAGIPLRTIQIAGATTGAFLGLPISYFFFRRSVQKLLTSVGK